MLKRESLESRNQTVAPSFFRPQPRRRGGEREARRGGGALETPCDCSSDSARQALVGRVRERKTQISSFRARKAKTPTLPPSISLSSQNKQKQKKRPPRARPPSSRRSSCASTRSRRSSSAASSSSPGSCRPSTST